MKRTKWITTLLLASSACVPTGQGANTLSDAPPSARTDAPPPVYVPEVVVLGDTPVFVYETTGALGMAFDHLEISLNQFGLLARLQEEGPPEVASRMHGCQKIPVTTGRNVLRSLGVDVAATALAGSPGALYNSGTQALGAANFLARAQEGSAVTTAGATKLFDIFVAAAPTVIQAMPGLARCRASGQPTEMFDAAGTCTLNGIACLQGYKATPSQQAICNAAIAQGSTPAIGRTIAVAAILAAANTCE